MIPVADLPLYAKMAQSDENWGRKLSPAHAERGFNANRVLGHFNSQGIEYLFDDKPIDMIGSTARYGNDLTLSFVRHVNGFAKECTSQSERNALAVAMTIRAAYERTNERRRVVLAYCPDFDKQISYFSRKHKIPTIVVKQPMFASRYQGVVNAFCDMRLRNTSEGGWSMPLEAIKFYDPAAEEMVPIGKMTINEYAVLEDETRPGTTLLGRYDGEKVVSVSVPKKVFGVRPNGVRQELLADALLNSEIVLVDGIRGTGKTLLALATGFQLRQENKVARVIYLRNNIEMSEKNGFLPGELEAKADGFFKPAYQNIARIAELRGKGDEFSAMSVDPTANGRELAKRAVGVYYIEAELINYERGTTYDNSAVIVDEGQNFSADQLEAVIEGVGRNSRLYVLGNFSQTDDARLHGSRNGFVQVMMKLQGQRNVRIIRMHDAEMVKRGSIAATMAACANG